MKIKKLIVVNLIFITLIVGVLSACDNSDSFIKAVDGSDLFENNINTILPQTFVHNFVLEHFDGVLAEGKKSKKALILFMDGARADCIKDIAASDSGVGYLAQQGGMYLSFTGNDGKFKADCSTSMTSLLTGEWADTFGVVKATDAKGIEPLTMISKVEQRGKKTAIFSSNEALIKVQLKAEIDWAEKQKIQASFFEETNDQIMQKKLLRNVNNYDLTVGVYQGVEIAGKDFGFAPNKDGYLKSIETANFNIGEILSTIQKRENFFTEDWLILIGSTYGGEKDKTHSSNKSEVTVGWLASNKKINL